MTTAKQYLVDIGVVPNLEATITFQFSDKRAFAFDEVMEQYHTLRLNELNKAMEQQQAVADYMNNKGPKPAGVDTGAKVGRQYKPLGVIDWGK